jgi:hypothetical protein
MASKMAFSENISQLNGWRQWPVMAAANQHQPGGSASSMAW